MSECERAMMLSCRRYWLLCCPEFESQQGRKEEEGGEGEAGESTPALHPSSLSGLGWEDEYSTQGCLFSLNDKNLPQYATTQAIYRNCKQF